MTTPIECPEIEVGDRELCVRMPGGVRVCASLPGVDAPPLELAQQLMAQSTAAMAPLSPIFDVIGALTALGDLVTALVSDPFDIADAASELTDKLSQLAALVPQLSVPAMILDLVDVVLTYMDGMASALDVLAAQEARIQAAIAVAENENLDALRQATECASEQLAAQLANVKASAGPVDGLIGMINTFGSLVPGMPEIPTLGDLGDEVGVAADQLSALVAVLRSVRETIPI